MSFIQQYVGIFSAFCTVKIKQCTLFLKESILDGCVILCIKFTNSLLYRLPGCEFQTVGVEQPNLTP